MANLKNKIFTRAFGKSLIEFLGKKSYSAHFILTDDNTSMHCLPVLRNEVPFSKEFTEIKIYAGEKHKNLEAAEYVWKRLTEEHADRRAVLINLGGGMVCDLGGFAAATYKRGIDFIHVPTTLLSQCDACIGGKQGIDFMNFKNQIGLFQDPAGIFIHDELLKTLSHDQIENGFAEVVKHALIAGGKLGKLLNEVEDLSAADWDEITEESLNIKQAVVSEDPYEKNVRKVLNFGHTIGHALESFFLSTNNEKLHGFCVAAGMIGELYLSTIVCGLGEKKRDNALNLIRRHFAPMEFTPDDFAKIISFMKQDKKNVNGKIRMVLLQKPGKPVIDCEVSDSLAEDALRFILSFYSAD